MSSDPTEALILVYQQAYLALLTRLATRVARGNSVAYERAILSDVTEILTTLDANTRIWIEQQLPQVYLNGMSEAARQLVLAGVLGPEFRPTLTGINRQAVAILAANLYGDLSAANQFVGRRVQDLYRQAAIEAVTTKVSTGQTVREAQRNLRQRLADQGVTAFTDSRGRAWRLDAYSEMVARTTTAEATNRGTLAQLSSLGYDLVQITKHYPTCPLCAPYQGRIYSISGTDKRFPPLFGTAFSVAYATIHPNCAHRVVPFVEALATPAELSEALATAQRPFDVDPRSEAERQAYAAGQARTRGLRDDRRQWEQMRAVLPNEAPATLAGFRRMKQANSARYQELRRLYRDATGSGGGTGGARGGQSSQGEPSGPKVSQALTLPRGTFSERLQHALDVVDCVHRDGTLNRIPVELDRKMRLEGVITYQVAVPPVATRIRLNPEGPSPEFAFVHELGHFIDITGVGKGTTMFTMPAHLTPAQTAAATQLAAALRNSNAYQGLQTRLEGLLTPPADGGGPTALEAREIVFLRYLQSPEELFARAYAQFIATRSGDATLMAQLDAERTPTEGVVYHPQQWTERDFGPIATAIDRLFAAMGWQ